MTKLHNATNLVGRRILAVFTPLAVLNLTVRVGVMLAWYSEADFALTMSCPLPLSASHLPESQSELTRSGRSAEAQLVASSSFSVEDSPMQPGSSGRSEAGSLSLDPL